MKIVKYIFLLLVLASIAITVFIATQEGKYNIKEEKVINVPKSVLYNYINDYRNWENLGMLTDADTTAQYTYSENSVGKNATMAWVKNATNGNIQTINAVANDSISQKVVIDNLASQISWRFKDTLNSTKIAVNVQGHLTFTEKAYALINGNTNNKLKNTLASGLENLNTFLVKELKVYSVKVGGIVSKKGAFYLGQTTTSSMADINKKAGPAFERLLAFARENKITVTGSPFIIYKSIDKVSKQATYAFSIPIQDEIFTAAGSEYEGGKLLAFNALKTTLKGDYSHLPKAWSAAEKYMAENALQENSTGVYIEVYAKNIEQSRKPSTWVTDVYTPIGAPQIIPEALEVQNPYIKPRASGQAGYLPSAAKPRPVGTTTAATTKPASTGLSKPVTTPATTKPAATTTGTKPASTSKPVTPKPATGTGGTTTKPATTKPVNKPVSKPAAKPATPAPTNIETLDLNN